MTRRVKGIWLLILGLLGLKAPAVMAGDMALCLDGIVGGSGSESGGPAPVNAGCIDVLAWSWGQTYSVDFASGVAGSGKVSFDDLTIVKEMDRASDDLLSLVSTGKTVPSGEFKQYLNCADCEGQGPIVEIKMRPLLITSVSNGSANSDSRAGETITMTYDEVTLCVASVDIQGKVGPQECFTWSVSKQVPL